MQESTRYINYNKSGDTIKFIPSYNISDYVRSKETSSSIIAFNEIETDGYVTCEQYYKDSIEIGINQQFARDILPLGLKTELYMTGTMDMWVGESIENNINGIIIKENKGFIPQRSAKCAHPQIKRLSDEVYTLLKINYSKYYDSITNILDKHIKVLYKDFDASLYNDTFETLYNYHKHLDENKN